VSHVLAAIVMAMFLGVEGRARAEPPRPLTLADAESAALRHQPSVAQARGQVEAAAGRVEQARAGYLPQVTATGIYQRTTGNFASRPGALPTTAANTPAWNTNTYNYFNFGVTASQLIYDFGQTDGRWRAAAANRDAAAATEQATRAQTLLNVRRSYFQARATRELVKVAEDTLRNQEKHMTQTQGFVRAGIRPDIDLAQTRTALANARVQSVGASNNDAVARTALEQAMGVFDGASFDLKDTELPPVAGEDDASGHLVDQALRARPEVDSLDQQRRAQELTVRALRGGYGPTLAATAGASDNGTVIDHLVPNGYVGLTVAWPLLLGGLTQGQIREASGTLAAITAAGELLRLQIRVDVEQAQLGVAAAKASIEAAEEALASARDQLRLAERGYETGLSSAIQLGDAQVAATTAAAQEVGTRYNLSIARAQLLGALGTR
jgi:outer membrane protein